MNTISITVSQLSVEQADKILAAVKGFGGAEEISETVNNGPAKTIKQDAPKKAAPKKPKAAPVEVDDDAMGLADSSDDSDSSDESDDGFDLPGDDEEIVEETEDTYSVKDVLTAASAFRKSFSNKDKGIEATKAVMKKFKVKSFEDIKKQDYPAVMKMLAVKKK